MLKKIAVLLLSAFILLLYACTPTNDKRDLNFFVDKFQQAGFDIENIEDTPTNTLQAEDCITFTVGNTAVCIYEYETTKAAKKATKSVPTLQYSPVNGRFTIETTDGELMEFFASIY